MLSRRNIRIKVMQALYATTAMDNPKPEELVEIYQSKIDSAFELFLFNFYLVTEVAKMALQDAEKRKSKHLPTDIDKAFTAKLFENDAIQSFLTDPYIQKLIKNADFKEKAGEDMAEITYKKFVKEHKQEYTTYILKTSPSLEETRDIILLLYKYCVKKSEILIDVIWASYPCWIDDDSLVIGASKKLIKSLPVKPEFYKDYLPDPDAVDNFGKALIMYIGEHDEQLLKIITPELKNWESDRLAIVDMILLKMGAAEFLSSPSIPPKVTINEYVELAKAYSTDKSKQFVNGLLDKILKVLEKDDKIKKEGRGLIT